MDILLEGQHIRLDNRAVLGTGGEATVIRHDGHAIKVYHTPSAARAAKLKDMIALPRRLPPTVIAPQTVVYDPGSREVIGFAMRLLDPTYTVAAKLSNRRFRAARGIGTPDVGGVFIDGHGTLNTLHGAGFVVGDFNDLNVLFKADTMTFIDVDSYQFGRHHCVVATEQYVDPALYGVDLSQGVRFVPENDWYSYAVLLFKSLLLVHPYGGVHPGIKTLTARAQAGVTALDPGVRYPKIALHPDTLSDDLLDVFHRTFAKGERGAFPLGVLRAYLGALTECDNCGAFYPRERSHCPACTAKAPAIKPERKIVTDTCTVETLITAHGGIAFSKVVGSRVYAVAHEEGYAVLYRAAPGHLPERMKLFKTDPDSLPRYDVLGDYLIIAPDRTSEGLMVLDVSGDSVRGALQTTTRLFGDADAVFGASGDALYRIAGGYLMRGEIRNDALLERQVTSVMENQTWLRVAPDRDMALGYFRTFRTRQYFLINGPLRHEFAPAPLNDGESLKAAEVLFGGGAALLMRHTRESGVDYVRLDEIGGDGTVSYSRRTKRTDSPFFATLGGQAYMPGIVLHPTDDGIVQERLSDGTQRTFAATEPYIGEGDRLIPYQNGLLAVRTDRVLFIVLNA